jgi:hypothetical protein
VPNWPDSDGWEIKARTAIGGAATMALGEAALIIHRGPLLVLLQSPSRQERHQL